MDWVLDKLRYVDIRGYGNCNRIFPNNRLLKWLIQGPGTGLAASLLATPSASSVRGLIAPVGLGPPVRLGVARLERFRCRIGAFAQAPAAWEIEPWGSAPTLLSVFFEIDDLSHRNLASFSLASGQWHPGTGTWAYRLPGLQSMFSLTETGPYAMVGFDLAR